ncbi:mannose-binding protein [Streptomyces lanatus]|uniref:Mannose-binding protein n=1 Tax=Streptomyces lanatus TaxID=66900 RepID=A0ABV1XTN9_9ACTN|nr:mannose-binding protein [Streptomyces lanatus]
MSPQHPTPDANAEAAAARAGEAGLRPAPSAPDEPPASSSQAEAPPAETESGGNGAKPGAAEAESGSTESGESSETSAPPATATAATPTAQSAGETREERVAIAVAASTTPSGTKTDTGVRSGRPRKPVLAGAAIAGAALIAIPLFLAGAKDDGPPDSAKGLAAEGSDTVLNPTSGPADLDDFVAEKPSPSPKKAKPTKAEAPKVAVPEPTASSPKSSPSSTPKANPKAKPKPKATPKPNWSTETVYATSVLEVNQAWTTNRIRMVMQTDGNLVVYNEQGNPIWASMTFGANHRAIFQPDGNLVIHNGEDRPIWASQTWGRQGAQLVLRADAKVVIVHNGAVVWST